MADISQTAKRSVDRMMVRIEHLDKLLGLAGEVIITSSTLHELQRLLQDSASRQRPVSDTDMETVKTSNEAARRISQDLHDLVMDIRLVEIGETLRLFRRPVRDLARKLDREVDLVFQNEETMIDKALAERLVDPLLHLLRNAVDHGIEAPLERERAGKPARGRVEVIARDKEHDTEIIIRDDGRGIDAAAARARAVELGLLAEDEEVETLAVLSRTGFSTRQDVTSTSGRGVGLDIVRNAIEELDGSIRLESVPGEGAAFLLTIPKLRAVNIVDALTVRAGQGLYAFPIESIVSFLGVSPDDVQSALDKERYIDYLGEVIVLKNLLGVISGKASDEDIQPLPVTIIQGKAGKLALVVSELLGPQKLVNVPLDEAVFDVQGVMGTSVFAGGRVGLTLDPDEIALLGLGEGKEGHAARMAHAMKPAAQEQHPRSVASPPRAGESAAATSGQEARRIDLDQADVSDLLDELRRGLGELQDTLLSLEQQPEEKELLHKAFRLLHGAKGNFTMLEQPRLAEAAHMIETVLDYLRADRLPLTPERTDLLLDGVSFLTRGVEALPDVSLDPPAELLKALAADARREREPQAILTDSELVGQAFELSPTVELQVLSALKRGEHTYETFLSFESGRQADFLVAYLILRRLGLHGNVLASLPSVDEIEGGKCGTALKVLWATPLGGEALEDALQALSVAYGVSESHSTPVTIFRYGQE